MPVYRQVFPTAVASDTATTMPFQAGSGYHLGDGESIAGASQRKTAYLWITGAVLVLGLGIPALLMRRRGGSSGTRGLGDATFQRAIPAK